MYENIASMKGNFIGFHTYPIDPSGDGGTGSNEPAVWLGQAAGVNADGTLSPSSGVYPTAWATTLRAQWGMTQLNTSDYGYGADQLFSSDCYGHPAQSGDPALCPFPVDAAHEATLFNRVGELWQAAFKYAHAVGVKTCLGTESPMTPPPLGGGLVPLNIYYSASRGDHFATTTACAECDGDGYVLLGVAASVLAQAAPGAVALSTYYNGAVFDNMLIADGQTVPPGYDLVRVEGYAMPASGGNASLVDLVQFAVSSPKPDHFAAAAGSALAANATASGFASTGVIAQVWPASAAPAVTAQAFYEGALTRLRRLLGATLDYYWQVPGLPARLPTRPPNSPFPHTPRQTGSGRLRSGSGSESDKHSGTLHFRLLPTQTHPLDARRGPTRAPRATPNTEPRQQGRH